VVLASRSQGRRRVVVGHLGDFPGAHRAAQNGGPNPLNLVFQARLTPSTTPTFAGGFLRRRWPRLKGFARDFQRTLVPVHVEAGTHPKLVQAESVIDIQMTMDVLEVAGKMQLEQKMDRQRPPTRPDLGQHLVNRRVQHPQTYGTSSRTTPLNA
jgi:hypothetical protein